MTTLFYDNQLPLTSCVRLSLSPTSNEQTSEDRRFVRLCKSTFCRLQVTVEWARRVENLHAIAAKTPLRTRRNDEQKGKRERDRIGEVLRLDSLPRRLQETRGTQRVLLQYVRVSPFAEQRKWRMSVTCLRATRSASQWKRRNRFAIPRPVTKSVVFMCFYLNANEAQFAIK